MAHTSRTTPKRQKEFRAPPKKPKNLAALMESEQMSKPAQLENKPVGMEELAALLKFDAEAGDMADLAAVFGGVALEISEPGKPVVKRKTAI